MSNINATVVAHSARQLLGMRSEICTLVVELPLFIWAQMLTHRDFSRNGASARAIPVKTLIQQTIDNKVTPVYWGANKSGMQADAELTKDKQKQANKVWRTAASAARRAARKLDAIGAHKQIANRVLAPYSHIRVVITSTEWDNFYALRDHKDAQPEIESVAKAMRAAMRDSTPMLLKRGEWHLPFINVLRTKKGKLHYYSEGERVTLGEAKKISASCCAQASYRKLDFSIEKAVSIFESLVCSVPIHASPFEHQAKAKLIPFIRSRNFVGWQQYRVEIEWFYSARRSLVELVKKRIKWGSYGV